MSIQKKTPDQRSKAFWNFARHVSEEVGEWPTWKRQALVSPSGNVSHPTSDRGQRMAKNGARSTTVGRDAKTGRFISMKETERRKSTAVVETMKKKK